MRALGFLPVSQFSTKEARCVVSSWRGESAHIAWAMRAAACIASARKDVDCEGIDDEV